MFLFFSSEFGIRPVARITFFFSEVGMVIGKKLSFCVFFCGVYFLVRKLGWFGLEGIAQKKTMCNGNEVMQTCIFLVSMQTCLINTSHV